MNKLQVFKNPELGSIRTISIEGEPWFVGKDIALALGYGGGNDISKSLANAVARHVDAEDKGVTKMMTPGGVQDVTVINESGLYSLILSSKLDSAKKFKRWVTSEVLPSIRKTGKYAVPKEKLLCDVPENHKAQCIIQETRDLLTTMNVLLDRYNVYRSERDRECHLAVLESTAGELTRKVMDLSRVKYNLVERV